MSRSVRFTPEARAQFLEAVAYIASDRPLAAVAFRNRVNKELRQLVDFPDSGRRIPEFPQLPHRELLVDSYRFFYRLKGDVIWVVGAWHDAQLADEPSEPAGA